MKTYVAVQFKRQENGHSWGVVHKTWLAEDLKSTAWPLTPLDPEDAARVEKPPIKEWARYKFRETILAESGK